MTLHTSPCRRALRRQIRIPGDSIWISDQILAAAFERYCRVSRSCHRNVGHVPGPLEGQRRLGRRRMGAGTLQPDSPIPPWAFSTPMNLSQWQWEPPRNPSQLQQGVRMGLAARFMQWLQDLAYPELSDPSAIALDPSSLQAAREKPPWRREVDAFLANLLTKPSILLPAAARPCYDELRSAIVRGHISKEDILSTFTELWEALDLRFKGISPARGLYLDLASAVISGIADSRAMRADSFDILFWKTVVDRMSKVKLNETMFHLSNKILILMSKLPFNDEVSVVWLQLMDQIPPSVIGDMHRGVLSMLGSAFSAWGSSTRRNTISSMSSFFLLNPWTHDHPKSAVEQIKQLVNPYPQPEAQPRFRNPLQFPDDITLAHIRQLRRISKAMQLFSFERQQTLLDAATRMALNQTTCSYDALHNLRYSWLCVLAQMPFILQEDLQKVAFALGRMPGGKTILSDTDLCNLLLLKWSSLFFLAKRRRQERVCMVYDDWRCRTRGRTSFFCLALAIWVANQGRNDIRHFASLWGFMRKMERPNSLVDAIERIMTFQRRHHIPLDFLQTIAWTAQDHRAAIRLHDLYNSQRRRLGTKKQFNPKVFKKYVNKIIQDRSLSPSQIWKALDVEMYEKRPWNLHQMKNQHHGYAGERRAEVVREALKEIANSTHLSPRMIFRHMSQGIRFLDTHKDGLSVEDAKSLYGVLATELKAGRPGVLARCRWFIHLLRKYFGDDVARHARHHLWCWRYAVKQRLYGAGGDQSSALAREIVDMQPTDERRERQKARVTAQELTDKLAKEWTEKMRKEKEEKVLKEKEEKLQAERLRLRKERAERLRLRKERAERLRLREARAERLRKEREERLQKEREERLREERANWMRNERTDWSRNDRTDLSRTERTERTDCSNIKKEKKKKKKKKEKRSKTIEPLSGEPDSEEAKAFAEIILANRR